MDELSSVIRYKVDQKCIDTFHKRIKKEKGEEEDTSNKEENKKEE